MRVRLLFILFLSGCADSGGWQAIELGTDAVFRDLLFVDDRNGWIVGGSAFADGGVIGRTRDGGESWEFRSDLVPTQSTLFYLHAIAFVDSLNGCIVASGGNILRTEDGGGSWRRVRRGAQWAHLLDLDFVGETGWVIGHRGLLRTEDAGRTWRRINEDVHGRAIQFLDRDHGWIVGRNAAAYRTLETGSNWQRVEVSEQSDSPDFLALHFVDPSNGWIVGGEGSVFRTRDGGDTWTRQETAVSHTLTAVCFADSLEGWAAGFSRDDGTSVILHTGDGGDTWTIEATVTGEELWAIQIRGDHGWAVGRRVREEPQKLVRFTAPRSRP